MPLVFLVKIGALILYRSWRATLVLSFMVVSAVAALVFLSALAVGTNDAMIRNSTGLYSGHILGQGLNQADLGRMPTDGVERVLVRRHLPVLLRAGRNLEPLVLVGIDPQAEQTTTALAKKTVLGRYPLPGEPSLYLSRDTAQRLAVTIGDQVALTDRSGQPLKPLTVSGIYHTGITHLDQGLAFCPDAALPPGPAEITIGAFLRPDAPADPIVARWQQLLPAARFTAWTVFMPDLKQLIDLDYVCMGIVIVLVFAIVSVGISCTFLIFTLKNLREHGIMKAMGLRSAETSVLLAAQIGLLTAGGALLGTVLGALIVVLLARIGIDISAFTSHNQYFAVSGMLYPRLTPPALAAPPLAAISFGLAAALWPILTLIRKNPADILRNV